MGWRNRFDPTRSLVGNILGYVRRLKPSGSMAHTFNTLGTLGRQIQGSRKYGMRWEFLVPLIALLILVGSLILNALAPDPSSQVGEVPPTQTEQPSTVATSYPGPSTPLNPTFVAPGSTVIAVPGLTATATFSNTVVAIGPDAGSGYPIPIGPEPIGVPPGGGVPSIPDTSNQPPAVPPISVPTPPLLAPTQVPPAGGYPSSQRPGSGQPPAQATARPTQDVGLPSPTAEVPGVPTTDPGRTPEPGTTESPVAGTTTPTSDVSPTPEPTQPPPTPTARPSEILSGNLRWSAANSPVILDKDHALAAGSSLTIDPGVEVRVASGVQFTIAGTLRAQGSAAAPIRFVGSAGRWEGIAGTQGSTIILDQVQIRQAGQSGTAVSSTGGTLIVHNASLSDNGGGIVSIGSALDLRNTQISGNSIGGPAVNVRLPSRGAVSIINSIVGGNGTPSGAAQVLLTAEQSAGPITVDGNLFVGGAGSGMIINTAAPLSGSIRCNGFNGGTIGLQLAARRSDTAGFNLAIENNAFEGQTTYGATGTLAFKVTNNWWSDPSGPRDPQRNPQGSGVPIGVNLQFQPWLASRPACAPTR